MFYSKSTYIYLYTLQTAGLKHFGIKRPPQTDISKSDNMLDKTSADFIHWEGPSDLCRAGSYEWCCDVMTWLDCATPTRLWEDLCTSSSSSSLSSCSFWCICFILSISISNLMWIYQREERGGERGGAGWTYPSVCLCALYGTCCCWRMLAVSLMTSSVLSLAWLSRSRSCFLRSGSESEARSTGRLRSRIWAHSSSFCFCRRPTSDWLSCTHPHTHRAVC